MAHPRYAIRTLVAVLAIDFNHHHRRHRYHHLLFHRFFFFFFFFFFHFLLIIVIIWFTPTLTQNLRIVLVSVLFRGISVDSVLHPSIHRCDRAIDRMKDGLRISPLICELTLFAAYDLRTKNLTK